jgi:hypothetical protein
MVRLLTQLALPPWAVPAIPDHLPAIVPRPMREGPFPPQEAPSGPAAVAERLACRGVSPVSPDGSAGVERGPELDGRAHDQRGMRMDGVVVVDPGGDELENGSGVGQRDDADAVALEGRARRLISWRERTGLGQGTRPSWRARSRVPAAVRHEPLPERCSTGCHFAPVVLVPPPPDPVSNRSGYRGLHPAAGRVDLPERPSRKGFGAVWRFARGHTLVAPDDHDRRLAGRISGDPCATAQMACRSRRFREAVQVLPEALRAHLRLAGGAIDLGHAAIRPRTACGGAWARPPGSTR